MFPEQLRGLGARLWRKSPAMAIGIDVGRSGVRVAALRATPHGVALAGLASASPALPGDAWPAAALVRDTVGRACRGVPLRLRRPAMAVPAGGVLVRSVPVDVEAGEDDIAEAVERAARQLPLAAPDIRVAWAWPQLVSAMPAGATSPRSVLMVATRRDAVLERQRLAALAGLGRVSVDVDILAALRAACGPPGQAPGRSDVYVDAGSDSVRAVVMTGGCLPLLRILPVPQNCPLDGLAAVVAAAVQGFGEPAGPCAVVLAGGRAGEEGLSAAVALRTGLPCRLAAPFHGLIDEEGMGLMSDAVAATWPCAVGLALRALS